VRFSRNIAVTLICLLYKNSLGIAVVREIFKLAAVAAVILVAAILIALFASNYITAFRHGGTRDQAGEHVVGASNTVTGGGVSAISKQLPSPSPTPGPGMPETVQMPPGPGPAAMPAMPTPLMPQALPAPGTMGNPIMQPGLSPGMPGQAPGGGPGLMPALPTPVLPVMQPPVGGENPAIRLPTVPAAPGKSGLTDVAGWLMWLIPVLFPGLYPGWTWWTAHA
jgi:hypothetical protein